VCALLLVALSVWVYRDGWRDIFEIAWNDEESSHILLVPIVAFCLAWVRRGRWRLCDAHASYIGCGMVMVGAGLSYYGVGHAMQVAWHLGAVLAALGAAVTVLGWDVLMGFLPVFVVLLCLVPVPASVRIAMSLPLEQVTAHIVQGVMEIMGMSVERSGNLLSINGVDVTVAEACNGLRMICGLVLVIAAFVFGSPMRWYVRAILLALSPVLSIVLNVVRLVPTMLFFGYTSRGTAEMFHDASGWAMLPIAFLLLMGVLRLLRWACVPVMAYEVVY
jgi:exosortase